MKPTLSPFPDLYQWLQRRVGHQRLEASPEVIAAGRAWSHLLGQRCSACEGPTGGSSSGTLPNRAVATAPWL